jgi:hypothetical protein
VEEEVGCAIFEKESLKGRDDEEVDEDKDGEVVEGRDVCWLFWEVCTCVWEEG